MAFARPDFYIVAFATLAIWASFSQRLLGHSKRNVARLIAGSALLLLVLANAFFSFLDLRFFLFIPVFFVVSQLWDSLERPVFATSNGRAILSLRASLSLLVGAAFLSHAFLVEQQPFEPAVARAERAVDPSWPNVILIVLDTVRADHLSVYGYPRETDPNLAQLATHATLYRNAVATGAYSLPSHASLLTGLYPSWHGCHFDPPQNPVGIALNPSFETLAETLKKNGYRTFSVVANTAFLNPAFGLTQGFEYFDYRGRVQVFDRGNPLFLRSGISRLLAVYAGEEDRELYTRGANQINQATLTLLEQRLQPRDKFFLFLNYMDAHGPYLSPEPYNSMFPGKDPRLNARSIGYLVSRTLRESESLQEWEREHVVSQYDGAIRYLDEELGKLFTALKDGGLYDDSMIIVTSDHGEAFGEHNLMGHGLSVNQHQVHIPLIIKYPGQTTGQVVQPPVSLVDVVPTVLETAQVELRPPWVQGVDLRNPEELAPRTVFTESYPAGLVHFWAPRLMRTERAVYLDKFKLVVSTRGKRVLYDFEQDPLETSDLSAILPDTAEDLSSQLAGWSSQIKARDGKLELDAETLERLRSLGYVN